MKAFIAGNGSMGKRRERDLRALGVDATAHDVWPDRGMTPEQIEAFDAADVIVVSTPPANHGRIAVWAEKRGVPCFTEADVKVVRSAHVPSATPLFTDWFGELQGGSGVGYAEAYTLHVGNHLDDWHPGADKATYYAYQGDTAVREMVPFELIWLSKLFGPVTASRDCVHDRVALF